FGPPRPPLRPAITRVPASARTTIARPPRTSAAVGSTARMAPAGDAGGSEPGGPALEGARLPGASEEDGGVARPIAGSDAARLGAPVGGALGRARGAAGGGADGLPVPVLPPEPPPLADGTTVDVKVLHRYSRSVRPEAWIAAASAMPT